MFCKGVRDLFYSLGTGLTSLIILLTSLCQTILGCGNPVALQASETVESFLTLSLFPVFRIEIDGGTIFTQTHRPDGDRGTYWDDLYSLNVDLGSLAFCQDYPPSIVDLMRKANQPGGLAISKEEAVYLTARAKKHDLIGPTELVAVHSGLRIAPAMQALLKAAETNRLLQLPAIAGAWQGVCREIEDMVQP